MAKSDLQKVSYEHLKALCRMKPTLDDCAAFFGVSNDTIVRRCKEYEGLSFAVFRDKYVVQSRFDLVRKAIKMAEKSPAVMIFCLKNMANWTDKVNDENNSNEDPMYLAYQPKSLRDVGPVVIESKKVDDDDNNNEE